jgi:hypothetical protein
MNLELKHVLPYIPYGLTAICTRTKQVRKVTLLHFTYDNETVGFNHLVYKGLILAEHKPLLHPKSHIENLKPEIILRWGGGLIGKNRDNWANQMADNMINSAYVALRYDEVEFMLEHHVDVFGLLDQNLAVELKNQTT